MEDGFPTIRSGKSVLGQTEHLSGGKAPADRVIEEKVVQLVRANKVLGLLLDFPLFGRQKLRRNRGGEDVEQNAAQGFIAAPLRFVCHQMPHQRLGHRPVDSVH